MPPESNDNYTVFRDCFSTALLQRVAQSPAKQPKRRTPRRRKNEKAAHDGEYKPSGNDADDLSDFIEYLAQEMFASLPDDLQTLTYSAVRENPVLRDKYVRSSVSEMAEDVLHLMPTSVAESLSTYDLLPKETSFPPLFVGTLSEYVTTMTSPPPAWITTRTTACEICDRDWIPLTYHHLIPKQIHEKVLKRKWHEEWQLNSVAWLCRACHSFVHRIASNEELAKNLCTVDLLLERDDVKSWATWIGRVRWKAR